MKKRARLRRHFQGDIKSESKKKEVRKTLRLWLGQKELCSGFSLGYPTQEQKTARKIHFNPLGFHLQPDQSALPTSRAPTRQIILKNSNPKCSCRLILSNNKTPVSHSQLCMSYSFSIAIPILVNQLCLVSRQSEPLGSYKFYKHTTLVLPPLPLSLFPQPSIAMSKSLSQVYQVRRTGKEILPWRLRSSRKILRYLQT